MEDDQFLAMKRAELRQEAKLRRKALNTGIPIEKWRERYQIVPMEHSQEVLDRQKLKEASLQLHRRVRICLTLCSFLNAHVNERWEAMVLNVRTRCYNVAIHI